LHIREFRPDDLELRDDPDSGMTVTGLVVPYGVEAPIVEPRHDGVIEYREMFVPGAFQRSQRVPHRVSLTYSHDTSLGARMGYGTDFHDTPEGLVGTFRLDPSSAAKARDILTSSHRALSVGFMSIVPRAGTERAGSLVVRKAVHVDHVAAVVQPAYTDAAVTSIRSAVPGPEGDPTDAEVTAEQEHLREVELLAWVDEAAAEQARWAALKAGAQ
jgi:HK97 family phage prohead protease